MGAFPGQGQALSAAESPTELQEHERRAYTTLILTNDRAWEFQEGDSQPSTHKTLENYSSLCLLLVLDLPIL